MYGELIFQDFTSLCSSLHFFSFIISLPLSYNRTYDVQSKSFYAVSKIHRQAILMTAVKILWIYWRVGRHLHNECLALHRGDMVNAATTGVKSYLHILERRITQADIDAIGI